jgi:hypothetical protein
MGSLRDKAAARSNKSGAKVTIAFNLGFNASMRSRWASATSSGETDRARINSANSVNDLSGNPVLNFIVF